MSTPWICNRCGEIAEGELCRACGTGSRIEVVPSSSLAGYQQGTFVSHGGPGQSPPPKYNFFDRFAARVLWMFRRNRS